MINPHIFSVFNSRPLEQHYSTAKGVRGMLVSCQGPFIWIPGPATPHVILPSHLLLGPAVRAQVVWEIAKRCGNASATVFNFFWGREPRLTYPQGHTVHLGVKKHAELYLKFEPYRYDFVGTKRLYYNPYKEKKCFLIRTVVVKSM